MKGFQAGPAGRERDRHQPQQKPTPKQEGPPSRTALPLSSRDPAETRARRGFGRIVTSHVTRREPHSRRGSSSWMPATAAIDNETLDHLLSVVADGPTLRGI